MDARIELNNVSVWGVDTHARAATFRQWFTRGKSIRSARIPILRDVTFHAKAGERIAIIGMNGSGKSSLLKVISGNYPIHEGTREVKGTVVPLIEMGAGFEGESTGRSNIKLTYAYRGKLREYSQERVEEIVAFSELGEKINLPLKTYSSGMTARLAFSSAIFQHPDILLLDEVFAAGDAGFIAKARKTLRERVDEVSIAIMVDHGSRELSQLCTRFVLMHQGQIIDDGNEKEIMGRYRKEILHLPETPAPKIATEEAYVPGM